MKRGGSKDRSIKLSTRDKKNNQAKVISDQSKVPPKSQGRLITTMYDFDIDDGEWGLYYRVFLESRLLFSNETKRPYFVFFFFRHG